MTRRLRSRTVGIVFVIAGLLIGGQPPAREALSAQLGDRFGRTENANAAPALPPPAALPTNPSLALSWPDGPSYVGVPITLAVQARTPDGQTDTTRAGAVQLLIDDPRAIITTTGTNPTTLIGTPVTLSQRFTTTLSGGAAQVAVNFSLPGRHTMLAQTAGDPPVAGESPALVVQPVVLSVQAAGSLTQASKGRVSVVVQDEQGRPVPGYARPITVVTDDPDATVAEAGAPDAQAKAGGLAHAFTPSDAGKANLDVKFARAGTRRIEVRDALDHTPLATLPVSVAAAPASSPTPPSTPPATASATAMATPGPGASSTASPATPAAVATVPAATRSPAPGTTRGDTAPDTAAAPVGVPASQESSDAAQPYASTAPVPELRLVSAQAAPRFSVSMSSSTATTGIALTMTVQALDANGALNTGYTGTIQLTATDPGFAPGTAFRYTFTTGNGSSPDNGVHTFSVTFNTLGSQTITVTDTTTPSMTGTSPSVTVSGIPYFTVTPSSSTATAGTALTVTVRAYDANGALNTGYTGTVQLSSSDAAFLPGVNYRYTFNSDSRNLDNGVHTFSVTFNATGTQRLAVQDTANPAMTGQSTAVTVGAASGAYFSVSPSTFTPTAGTALTMTVTARNPNGTTNTSYGGTVQFTSTDPAFAPGTSYRYTFIPDPRGDNGVHAFSVTFETTGSQTLTVTDTTTTAMTGTSAAVTVGAAGGTGYTFSWSSSTTNAGVPDTLTVSYPYGGGRGLPTIQFTSPDPTFSPGPSYSYTFTTADAGSHAFPITFNTAGTQSITVTDGTYTSTSPTVSVAETVFTATFGASQVTQGVSVNLTVQAKTTGGTVLTGYRGTVRLSASYQSVLASAWGSGVDPVTAGYTFTATDSGSHVFTPAFSYAGDQTATVTDAALSSRTVTSGTITVTNAPAASYSHEAAPSGTSLADGSVVWAYLGVRGRLWTRRQVGASLTEPAWRPAVMVRDVTTGQVGVDSPSIVRLGSTLALFHSYPDAGGILQVWLTTSTDNGLTWGTPTQLTTESGHVGRVQAVVSGSTVYLFFSRQDTSGKLYYQTSTTLTSWSTKTLVGQSVGALAANTTSHFGIVKLSSGSWLLGWLGTPIAGEPPLAPTGSLTYPTVRVATSSDLSTWSSATELTQPYTQRWPKSVALMQEAGGTIRALTEQYTVPKDSYLLQRTSTNGTSWTAPATVGYDRVAAADGTQGYVGQLPTFAAGTTQCAWSLGASGGTLQSYGTMDWNYPDSLRAVAVVDCASPVETLPMPPGDDPRTVAGGGADGTDLTVAARMMSLTVSRSYASHAALAGQSGPFGVGWGWSYGARAITHLDGSVTIIEASGKRSNFWKSGSSWTVGPGINATLAAVGGGGYTLTTHSQAVVSFDSSGKLTSIADRNGNTLTITYAGSTPTTITGAGGRALTITTDGQGRITAVNGPMSLSSTYTYDASGNLATATDASGAVTTYTYDSRHQLLTVTDGRGVTVSTNTYGTLGRMTRQDLGYWTDGRGGSGYLSTVSYAPAAQGTSGSWSPSVVTDGRGNQTRITTDAGLRSIQTEVWDMGVRTGHPVPTMEQRTLATYNANGDVLTATDPLGRVTNNTYDSHANLLTTTRDSGTGGLNLTTTNTYNATNDLLTRTDPLGHTVTNTYDPHGNLLTVTDPLSHTTTNTYDSYGERLTTTDATGRVTASTYTTAGDLASTTIASGTTEATTTTYAYDAAGRRTGTTDALNHISNVTYDGMGRVLTTTNALGKTWTTHYDAVGNRIQATDPLGHTTTWSYDALGQLVPVTEPGGGTTSYTWDTVGNLTATTDANTHSRTAAYDALGRLVSETDALGHTTTYAYDAAGNRTSVSKPGVATINYTFDRVNRLTGITASSLSISYTYDAASRRTSMIDGTGTTTYTYDTAGRATSITAPSTGTVSYAYDTAGRRTSITYPSTHQVSSTYTQRGELATVTDWLGGVTSYSYDATGRWTGASIPNSVAETLTYDNANQLLCISHGTYTDTLRGGGTVTEGICYTYDDAGNRLTRNDNVTGGSTWTYDPLNRLTGDSGASYTYDAVGNRTSETFAGTTTTYAYDFAGELLSKGSTTYAYDFAGREISKTDGSGTTTYIYDPLDRLLSANGETYTYNGDGLRVSKTVGSTTTRYTWDLGGSSQLLAESDGTTTKEYVYGKALIAEITGTSATYHHADGIGTSVVTTNGSGQSVGARGYDAFGRITSSQGVTSSLGFTGEPQDSSTGLVYLRARWYDPDTGRFLTKDPYRGRASDPTSQHPYVYARNNPVRWTDPSGRSAAPPPTIQSLLDNGSCGIEADNCRAAYFNALDAWFDDEATVISREEWGTITLVLVIGASQDYPEETELRASVRIQVTNPNEQIHNLDFWLRFSIPGTSFTVYYKEPLDRPTSYYGTTYYVSVGHDSGDYSMQFGGGVRTLQLIYTGRGPAAAVPHYRQCTKMCYISISIQ